MLKYCKSRCHKPLIGVESVLWHIERMNTYSEDNVTNVTAAAKASPAGDAAALELQKKMSRGDDDSIVLAPRLGLNIKREGPTRMEDTDESLMRSRDRDDRRRGDDSNSWQRSDAIRGSGGGTRAQPRRDGGNTNSSRGDRRGGHINSGSNMHSTGTNVVVGVVGSGTVHNNKDDSKSRSNVNVRRRSRSIDRNRSSRDNWRNEDGTLVNNATVGGGRHGRDMQTSEEGIIPLPINNAAASIVTVPIPKGQLVYPVSTLRTIGRQPKCRQRPTHMSNIFNKITVPELMNDPNEDNCEDGDERSGSREPARHGANPTIDNNQRDFPNDASRNRGRFGSDNNVPVFGRESSSAENDKSHQRFLREKEAFEREREMILMERHAASSEGDKVSKAGRPPGFEAPPGFERDVSSQDVVLERCPADWLAVVPVGVEGELGGSMEDGLEGFVFGGDIPFPMDSNVTSEGGDPLLALDAAMRGGTPMAPSASPEVASGSRFLGRVFQGAPSPTVSSSSERNVSKNLDDNPAGSRFSFVQAVANRDENPKSDESTGMVGGPDDDGSKGRREPGSRMLAMFAASNPDEGNDQRNTSIAIDHRESRSHERSSHHHSRSASPSPVNRHGHDIAPHELHSSVHNIPPNAHPSGNMMPPWMMASHPQPMMMGMVGRPPAVMMHPVQRMTHGPMSYGPNGPHPYGHGPIPMHSGPMGPGQYSPMPRVMMPQGMPIVATGHKLNPGELFKMFEGVPDDALPSLPPTMGGPGGPMYAPPNGGSYPGSRQPMLHHQSHMPLMGYPPISNAGIPSQQHAGDLSKWFGGLSFDNMPMGQMPGHGGIPTQQRMLSEEELIHIASVRVSNNNRGDVDRTLNNGSTGSMRIDNK